MTQVQQILAIMVASIVCVAALQVQLPQFRRAGMEVTAIASRKEESAVTVAAQVQRSPPPAHKVASADTAARSCSGVYCQASVFYS